METEAKKEDETSSPPSIKRITSASNMKKLKTKQVVIRTAEKMESNEEGESESENNLQPSNSLDAEVEEAILIMEREKEEKEKMKASGTQLSDLSPKLSSKSPFTSSIPLTSNNPLTTSTSFSSPSNSKYKSHFRSASSSLAETSSILKEDPSNSGYEADYRFSYNEILHKAGVVRIVFFAKESDRICSGGKDGKIIVFSLQKRTIIVSFTAHDCPITDFDLGGNNGYVITASKKEGVVRLWKLIYDDDDYDMDKAKAEQHDLGMASSFPNSLGSNISASTSSGADKPAPNNGAQSDKEDDTNLYLNTMNNSSNTLANSTQKKKEETRGGAIILQQFDIHARPTAIRFSPANNNIFAVGDDMGNVNIYNSSTNFHYQIRILVPLATPANPLVSMMKGMRRKKKRLPVNSSNSSSNSSSANNSNGSIGENGAEGGSTAREGEREARGVGVSVEDRDRERERDGGFGNRETMTRGTVPNSPSSPVSLPPSLSPCGFVTSLLFSPASDKLFVGDHEGWLEVYKCSGLMEQFTLVSVLDLQSPITSITHSAARNIVAANCLDDKIKLFEVDELRCKKVLFHRQTRFDIQAHFQQGNSGYFISGGEDNFVRVFDISKGSEVAKLVGMTSVPMCVASDEKGDLLVAGDALGKIAVWRSSKKSPLLSNEPADNALPASSPTFQENELLSAPSSFSSLSSDSVNDPDAKILKFASDVSKTNSESNFRGSV